jgi:hypothetical protein
MSLFGGCPTPGAGPEQGTEQSPEQGPVRVELEDGRTAYRPGEEVTGTVSWELPGDKSPEDAPTRAPTRVEVRLAWYTRGRGDRDTEIVASQVFEAPGVSDRRSFRFRLPDGPYSFSGKLISLVWTAEAVLEPGSRPGRADLVVSPTGKEVLLHPELAEKETG